MSAKSESLSIVCMQFELQKLSVIWSMKRLSIEVNGRTVRTFIISWVSAVEGCPLGGIH